MDDNHDDQQLTIEHELDEKYTNITRLDAQSFNAEAEPDTLIDPETTQKLFHSTIYCLFSSIRLTRTKRSLLVQQSQGRNMAHMDHPLGILMKSANISLSVLFQNGDK
ncbi:MAG: hypothetical protein Q9214_005174, partial [Letrouitia sp. 1 TL-2023]